MKFIRLTPADNKEAEVYVNPEYVAVVIPSEWGTSLFLSAGGFLHVLEPSSEVADSIQEALRQKPNKPL